MERKTLKSASLTSVSSSLKSGKWRSTDVEGAHLSLDFDLEVREPLPRDDEVLGDALVDRWVIRSLRTGSSMSSSACFM